ncbi:hypothetical protein [Jannaschia pohangensis]|uniref:Uncharacterized protein n=1 Tax=Jannaschia pohangensis TaxID=390807 RepID=A0A1I3NKZ2_9RHOB|nr:hypothetical protein [Jannaschia pohangensis]SFJ09973.1 hypothetical protein SAMN04488095_2187 [Jannaschia pohangensis]
MTFDAEQLKNQIPFYLTSEPEQKELVENLDALSRGVTTGYYVSSARDPDANSVLQGDGWQDFQLFSFDVGEKRSVRGIVLSNSCDISADNERAIAPKLVFAPIVRLSAIQARMIARGLPEQSVKARVSAIKSQSVTSMFYLPADGLLDSDYVALLDDLHSMPIAAFSKSDKLFTLSMAGFYLFAFKLSVHFCRLHENVDRRPGTKPHS